MRDEDKTKEQLIGELARLRQCAAELETTQSECRRAEEALRESEVRFRLMTETIQDVFWMSTPGIAEMIYVSPAYEEIWGRTRDSLYRSPKSFMEAIHPEDRERVMSGVNYPPASWGASRDCLRAKAELHLAGAHGIQCSAELHHS